MPPAISDDESSVDETAFSASHTKPNPSREADQENEPRTANGGGNDDGGEDEDDEDDDDDGQGGEEYVVDAIINHAFEPDGSVKYEVRWAGYDETTWEPLRNLDTCPAELKAYHKKNGGPPVRPPPKNASSKGKRKLSSTPVESGVGKGAKGKKRKSEEPVETMGDKRKWKPPYGSWELEINSIDTVEKSENGEIMVFLVWKKTGNRSMHPSGVVRRKCPQKLLDFYESHLHFNHTAKANGDDTAS